MKYKYKYNLYANDMTHAVVMSGKYSVHYYQMITKVAGKYSAGTWHPNSIPISCFHLSLTNNILYKL